MAESPIPAHLLRVLRYVQAVNRGGARPRLHDVDAFAVLSPPSAELAEPWALRGPIMSAFLEREPVSAYMKSVGWLNEDDGLVLSATGSALLAGVLDDDSLVSDELTAVILSPEDPMRYELLTREVGRAGAGLLVDPYLKPGHIDWLSSATTIKRVLVGGKRPQEKDNAILPLALGRALSQGRTPPEVRISRAASLHDRVLLFEDGSVSLLGSSLTGISMHVTAIVKLPAEAGDAYRTHVESLWDGALPVEPRDGIVTQVSEASSPSVEVGAP